MPGTVPRTVTDGITILGLSRKIGNANTSSDRKAGAFVYLQIFDAWNNPRTVPDGMTILGLPGKIGIANINFISITIIFLIFGILLE